MLIDISSMRKIYSREELNEAGVPQNPFELFTNWFGEAVKSQIDEPNAMTLATSDKNGFPSARIVLLKGYSEEGFIFFTNYGSRKGREIQENPHGALLFFWKELERQVRITGSLEKVDRKESERYFHSRPFESQIGALVSNQSDRAASRIELENKFKKLSEEFAGKQVPLPPFWGGYRLLPRDFEFWQGRTSRLHDRIIYEKQADFSWKIGRLSP